MKLRHFVSGSAVVLGLWLAITFVHEVPTKRYPKLDKYRRSAEAGVASDPSGATAADTAAELLQVSVSP
jgi:hypothetical protein